ncbi:SGNH/GDSL hydrolase family protein [Actinoplanes sp. DH11]|uniref:SGNH/GDSL hydrolase family protein n=1 Tax=Actinoplanes sp. DH11 TaxID=2857011 RepID=UPI001E34FF54|nr:SGNH/GDSL hydrolase family protein [Actinoplanes sp. DH11]
MNPVPMIAAALMATGVALAAPQAATAATGTPPAARASAAGQASAAAVRQPIQATPGIPVRIMPFGDSLTFGKGDRAENGYRAELFTWLALAGVHADFVGSQRNGSGADTAHEGHPGWRIAWLNRHTDFWMRKHRPQVVLLDIGTNDLLRNQAAGAPRRLDQLIDRMLATDPKVRIVLAKLLVVRGRHEKEFRSFNATLARAAARHPGNVTLVDMSAIPATDTVDGVHPDELGYRKMAYQWFQGLRQILPGGRSWQPVPNPFSAGR